MAVFDQQILRLTSPAFITRREEGRALLLDCVVHGVGTHPSVRWALGQPQNHQMAGGRTSASQADSEGSIPFTRSNFRAASSLNSFRCGGYVGHFIEAEEFDRSLGRGHMVLRMLAIHLHLPKFARFESPPSSAWEAVRLPPGICGLPRRSECPPDGGTSSRLAGCVVGTRGTSRYWEAVSRLVATWFLNVYEVFT
jgi:hypothetical protein